LRNRKDPYWFGYDHKWREFITSSKQGFFILGGMNLDKAFAIPASVMEDKLKDLNTTDNAKGMWWHIVIRQMDDGRYVMSCSKTGNHLDLTPYALQI